MNFTRRVRTANPSSACCALRAAELRIALVKILSEFLRKQTTAELQSVGIYKEIFFLGCIDTDSRTS